jgi:ribonuclease BN (tRNA processing enzyme)
MQLHICGVRGSTPAPGAEFVRYGGHTSCVAIAHDGELPSLVLDAGTGLQRLSRAFDGTAFAGSILLSHLHWDHTHGLPFFPAGDRPEARVHLMIPAQEGGTKVLEQLFAPPHFPITPAELRGDWTIALLEAGDHKVEGFSVTALDIPHKGGRTFGFRVSDGGASLAYLSDHSPVNLGPGPMGDGELHEAALSLVYGVDVLLHDAQYTAAEFPARKTFGHTTMDYAVRLAEAGEVGSLLLFHHDSARTDDALDACVASLQGRSIPVAAAAEGMVLDLRVIDAP